MGIVLVIFFVYSTLPSIEDSVCIYNKKKHNEETTFKEVDYDMHVSIFQLCSPTASLILIFILC